MPKPKTSNIYQQLNIYSSYCYLEFTKNIFILFLFSLLGSNLSLYAQIKTNQEKFKVVLDAGHGDTDPGTIGNGLMEKDVAFDVTNRIAAILVKEPNIEVIKTRTTDFKVPLYQRASIANKVDANVFVSIHCNGVAQPRASGFETFVLGIRRNKDNLNTALRENAVIYLEDDYETRYGNFDPNSPESFISFTLMQEEYLDQSILLANYIQTSVIKKTKLVDRGVKQDVFLVLRETFMPSVLVELGFLTNSEDANLLKSEAGKNQMAEEIASSIIAYKKDVFNTNFLSKTTLSKEQGELAIPIPKISFSVQLLATSKNIDPEPKDFKGLEPLGKMKENGFHKIFYGYSENYMEAQELLQDALEKGFESAFIVAFNPEGKKITINEALKSKLK